MKIGRNSYLFLHSFLLVCGRVCLCLSSFLFVCLSTCLFVCKYVCLVLPLFLSDSLSLSLIIISLHFYKKFNNEIANFFR